MKRARSKVVDENKNVVGVCTVRNAVRFAVTSPAFLLSSVFLSLDRSIRMTREGRQRGRERDFFFEARARAHVQTRVDATVVAPGAELRRTKTPGSTFPSRSPAFVVARHRSAMFGPARSRPQPRTNLPAGVHSPPHHQTNENDPAAAGSCCFSCQH